MAQVLGLPEQATQKVILDSTSWETYQRLLAEHGERSGTRFTYDDGMLEITVVSRKHEEPNRTLALLVNVVAAELEVDVEPLGSTTFQREDLLKGFEPDSCFYIQNAGKVKGTGEIDLSVDPPPDLVIEIDITSPSLPRFPIFAAVGVPEVWHYDGTRVQIFKLEDGQYTEVERSLALPLLSGAVLTRFLEDSKRMKSATWVRKLRAWAQRGGSDV